MQEKERECVCAAFLVQDKRALSAYTSYIMLQDRGGARYSANNMAASQ